MRHNYGASTVCRKNYVTIASLKRVYIVIRYVKLENAHCIELLKRNLLTMKFKFNVYCQRIVKWLI